jgi:hypothetical protein
LSSDRILLSRRQVLLGAALGVAGCTPDGFYSKIYQSGQMIFGSGPRATLTREKVKALPYAQIAVSLDDSQPALVVLAEATGPELRWVSQDRVVFVTRGGRLIQTAGLSSDLQATSVIGTDPVISSVLHLLGAPVTVRRYLDLEDLGYGIAVESVVVPQQPETIEVLGRPLATIRVAETCRAAQIDWEHTNLYWADTRSGRIWRSQQHVHPDTPAITITLLKPATNT